MSAISHCPTCGSKRIRQVKKDWHGEYKGEHYKVPSLVFDECPDCGERIFDREATQRIQKKSPAYKRLYKKAA